MSATPRENGHHADTGAAGLGAPRRFGAAVAVALVLFRTGAVVLTASGTGLREKLLVSNCLFLVSGSAAAVCCLYTASRTTGALRRAGGVLPAMGTGVEIG